MRLIGKGPQRRIANVHPIPVGGQLCAGCGVLQIVFAVPFVHERAFNKGLFIRAAEAHIQSKQPHGEPFFALFLRPSGIVRTLPAVLGGVAENQLLLLSDGRHRFRVEFLAVDGCGVGAAPVEINPPVIVLEGVRIPKREGLAELFKIIAQRILAAVDGTGIPV